MLPNKQTEYKKLGSIINDARLAGEIDWDAIEDRTRFLRTQSHWDSPADIISACAEQFRIDKWEDQNYRPEVWIEKDALVGVIEGVCKANDVSFFSCRGYVSQSEMWRTAQRLATTIRGGQMPYLIHLGDHDPSGIDMSRDIADRIDTFLQVNGWRRGSDWNILRIALNMDQVRKHKPPPNPAKLSDSRAQAYIPTYGTDSWELDALDPATLATLIEEKISDLRDDYLWRQKDREQKVGRDKLNEVAKMLTSEDGPKD
jgi:hypothetical protein